MLICLIRRHVHVAIIDMSYVGLQSGVISWMEVSMKATMRVSDELIDLSANDLVFSGHASQRMNQLSLRPQ